ncbi:hypothetical protein NQ314_013690 [Rhamnusium bicolor]|uniref:RING-CH-type domain-containing protein n=1 Tax=Rhamnusium bicolor TaxID=1586634 RepID=A0AAV8X5D5_9CUCU|nr:hypothetical protein NQ314_013690 [Rhamnusium bicolor]
MPCTKCRSDFNLLNWKIKCGECDDKYCNKCLKRREGVDFRVLYCEKCLILLKRPPDRMKLMELKPKDLQDYLNKHNISTYGLVGNLESVTTNENRQTRPGRPEPMPPPSSRPRAPQPPPVSPTNTQATFTTHVPQPPPVSPTNPQPMFTHSPTFTTQTPTTNPQPQPTTSTPEFHENTASFRVENLSGSRSQLEYPNIEDFGSAEELHNLSSKDLKILLTLNRVDFKGCVEKSELLERAERLWEDNNEQKKVSTLSCFVIPSITHQNLSLITKNMQNENKNAKKDVFVTLILTESTSSLLNLNLPHLEHIHPENSKICLITLSDFSYFQRQHELSENMIEQSDNATTSNEDDAVNYNVEEIFLKISSDVALFTTSNCSSSSCTYEFSDEDIPQADVCEPQLSKVFEATKIHNRPLVSVRSIAHSNKLSANSNNIYVSLLDSDSKSSSEYICRICHGGESMDDLLTPCRCRGTIALVHLKCLERWLKESNHSQCELCQHHYKIIREPR